jgi:hypothetical protein
MMTEQEDNKDESQGNELEQYLQQMGEMGQHSYDPNYWASRGRIPPHTQIIADRVARTIPKWVFLGFGVLLLVCFSWLGWGHISSGEPETALQDLVGIVVGIIIIIGNITIR